MSLLEKLKTDLNAALKQGLRLKVDTLRYMLSQLQYARIEKGQELDDEEVIALLTRQARSRGESIEAFQKAGREELAEKERRELEVLTAYLPEPITEQQIDDLLQRLVAQLECTGPSDLGRLMKAAMAELKGRADGNLVSRLARQRLQQEGS